LSKQTHYQDKSDDSYLITFFTTHHVMQAERLYLEKEDKIQVKLIPTPREISSDCGFSIVTPRLSEKNISGVEAIYRIRNILNSKEILYEKIT
jgi:hypothetical protein